MHTDPCALAELIWFYDGLFWFSSPA